MEFMKSICAKINRALVGLDICDFLIPWLVDWLIAMHDWFIPHYGMHAIILCLIANICFPLN